MNNDESDAGTTREPTKTEFEKYIDWLSDTKREDYEQVEIDGLSIGDRAAERGVAWSTVKQNVDRARQRMKEIWREQEDV